MSAVLAMGPHAAPFCFRLKLAERRESRVLDSVVAGCVVVPRTPRLVASPRPCFGGRRLDSARRRGFGIWDRLVIDSAAKSSYVYNLTTEEEGLKKGGRV